MFTLTEETIVIPAGTFAVGCAMCNTFVYMVPRPSNVKMAVEVASDDHRHPRIDTDGVGRPHLKHCRGRK